MIIIKSQDIKHFHFDYNNNLSIRAKRKDCSINIRSASLIKDMDAMTIQINTNVKILIDYKEVWEEANKSSSTGSHYSHTPQSIENKMHETYKNLNQWIYEVRSKRLV